MDHGIHFISGLPRSGSTLLAAILRQNPRFHAGITSPVGGLFATTQRHMTQESETAIFWSNAKRSAVLRGLFDSYYADEHPRQVVFDTHRMWAAKTAALQELFPESRVICCVRHVPWIVDSLERLVCANPLEVSRIYNFDTSANIYARYEMISSGTGLVGYAWNSLRDGFFGPCRDRMMLLTYETLTADPDRAVRAVYDFIGEPLFAHQFDRLEFATAEFDARLGAPGLHTIRPKVCATQRETILPPDLFRRVAEDSFWQKPEASSLGVLIV